MNKVKIEIIPGGARAVMTSPEVVSVLEGCAEKVLERLPAGYEISVYPNGKSRANVSVYAESAAAKADNAKNNSLLKALGGGV